MHQIFLYKQMVGKGNMHLVIVTNELATADCSSGGLASFTANLARIFWKNGHKVTILLVTTKENEITFDEGINLRNVYVEKAMWNKIAHMAENISFVTGEDKDIIRRILLCLYKSELVNATVKEMHRKEQVDMIHVCNLDQLALGLDGSIPYVVRLSSYMWMCNKADLPEPGDEYYDEAAFTFRDKLDISLLKKSKYIISPSNLLAEIGKQKMGINPVVIESPFVLDRNTWDDSIYRLLAKGKRYIIHHGRGSYLKGTHIVAQIAKKILENHPDMYLLLAGVDEEMQNDKGQMVMANELVREYAGRYADRVIYVGGPVREQLYPLIDNAELCILPSRIENLSNACIEAMAMGKVVVATNGASYEQLIDDRVSGFLCERDNPESFLQAVEEALSMNEEEKQKMIEKASMRIQQLSPEIIYEKYFDFYKQVMQEWGR